MQVTMSGVADITDILRDFTNEERDKRQLVGGHTYPSERHEFLSGYDGHNVRGYNGGQFRNTNSTSNTPTDSNR